MQGRLSQKWFFSAIGALALLAGAALWWVARPAVDRPPGAEASSRPSIAPAALYAAAFTDDAGQRQPLGRFQGKVVVLNFWATWCAPCREEMPAFTRVQSRWRDRGVQFVGLSSEDPALVARFGRELGVNYPLWTGGDDVGELSRRLGNRLGVLPHTAILGPTGAVLDMRVGPYTEAELEARLAAFAPKSS